MNIQSAVTEGTNILKNRSILSAKLDSEILMAKALDKKREYIILNNDEIIKEQNLEYFYLHKIHCSKKIFFFKR